LRTQSINYDDNQSRPSNKSSFGFLFEFSAQQQTNQLEWDNPADHTSETELLFIFFRLLMTFSNVILLPLCAEYTTAKIKNTS
jgi:hypothetical protein